MDRDPAYWVPKEWIPTDLSPPIEVYLNSPCCQLPWPPADTPRLAGLERHQPLRRRLAPCRECRQSGLIGAAGFEPTISCSQGRRPTRLGYAPLVERVGFEPTQTYGRLFYRQAPLPDLGTAPE